MTSTFRGACRTLLPLLLVIGAAAAHAQTTPPAKVDSTAAAKTDSARAQQAPKKHGFFSRITSAASHASAVVEQKTGINPENALQGAALIAARANPAVAMMQAMQAAQQIQGAQAAQMAGAAMGGRGSGIAGIAGMGMGMATGAAQMQVMNRLQKMMGGAAGSGAVPGAQNAELAGLQLQMAQIATAASKGDQNSMMQLMRFQNEMGVAMMRLSALGPAAQQSALPAAMRAAIACATTGQGCTAGTK